jgi:hypothetical protein
MSEEYRDPTKELEDQMRAADELIKSLEVEVEDLRRDLEQASGALRAARKEVTTRGQALEDLEESEQARASAAEEAQVLREDLTELRQRSADEQLRLRNQHIAEMAALREELEELKRTEVATAQADNKIANLREESHKERAALEARHKAEVEELKRAAQQWEEQLRDGYRELEERHSTEIEKLSREYSTEVETLQREYRELQAEYREEVEALRAKAEEQKTELERTIREELGRERDEELRAERERHAVEVESLKNAAANRELELQKELREAAESHQAEVEALRFEIENTATVAEERREKDLKEVKRLADSRERELKRTQTARLAKEKEAAERRVAALKAQREADISTLKEWHSKELEKVRRALEEGLTAGEERQALEVARLQEEIEGLRARRNAESRLYGERLSELERSKVAEQGTKEKELERRLAEAEAEKTRLEDRVAELQDALEESGALESELREALEESSVVLDERRQEDGEAEGISAEGLEGRLEEVYARRVATEELEGRLEEADAARLVAEERAADLEARLRQAEEENRRRARELEKAREGLEEVSNPEQRLRSGISLFNASDHTRTVASISKALGLPRVHVSADGGPDSMTRKPVITFIWEEMAWRRYVSDPTEGVEEPRVYLIGTGNDPDEIKHPEPNARMDARGRLILGVQAF